MVFENPADEKAVTSELVKRVNENSRRVRALEQNIDRIESNISVLEENAIGQMKDLKLELDKIAQKIAVVSDRLSSMENEISRIDKLLGKTATKAELKQIESFIDLVNPITSKFVTKDELERALQEKIKIER